MFVTMKLVAHHVASGRRHDNHNIAAALAFTLLFTLPCAKAHMQPIAAACCPLLPPFTNATSGANAPASSVSSSPQHQTTPARIIKPITCHNKWCQNNKPLPKKTQPFLTQLSQRDLYARVMRQVPQSACRVLFFSVAAVFEKRDKRRKSMAVWEKWMSEGCVA